MPVLDLDAAPVPAEPPSGGPVGGAPTDPPRSGSRRRWVLATVAVVVVAGGGILAATQLRDDAVTEDAAAATDPRPTAEATVTDVVRTSDVDGVLTLPVERAVVTPGGTVTDVVADGSAIQRGDVVLAVDDRPVVAIVGDAPLYRPLELGTEGPDVRVLEEHLVALGHHRTQPFDPDDGDDDETGLVVDGVFDDDTRDAVLRWQEDIGLPTTGVVAPTDVVPGPATATGVTVEVGDRVGEGQVPLRLATADAHALVATPTRGEVEPVVAAGDELVGGTVLFIVDELPSIAVVTDVVLDRDLAEGVDDGDDVEVLEQLLVDLGHADDELVVDRTFDEATADAVQAWEETLAEQHDELVPDGEVDAGQLLAVAGGVVTDVESYEAAVPGDVVVRVEPASRARTVAIDVDADERASLAVGDPVTVTLPDGTVVDGAVAAIATSSAVPAGRPDAAPAFAVEIDVPDVGEAAVDLVEVDVEVGLVDRLVADATTVPVTALVAAADGRFAVEVVEADGTTRFVAVEPGLFADGRLAVTGIEPGTTVVVSS